MKLKLIFILMLILNAGLIKANSVDFYFDFGSSTLSSIQKDEIKSLVDFINHDALAIFVLEGFADKIGGIKANEIVANKRSSNVKEYLLSLGVTEERIFIKRFNKNKKLIVEKFPLNMKNHIRELSIKLTSITIIYSKKQVKQSKSLSFIQKRELPLSVKKGLL